MKLQRRAGDETSVCVGCAGEITLDHLITGVNLLNEVLAPSEYAKRVYLDLEAASFIDSAGIGWLVACHKRFVQNNGKLVLHSLPPMVEQVIQLLKLHTVLNLAKDLEQAKSK
jgi:anti-anti-sigma factor